jgi:hypothetical protein
MITLLLICPLLPFIIMAIFKGNRLPSRSRGAAWVCGYDHEQSMVITAHGFAMPVKKPLPGTQTAVAESGITGSGLAECGCAGAVPSPGAD